MKISAEAFVNGGHARQAADRCEVCGRYMRADMCGAVCDIRMGGLKSALTECTWPRGSEEKRAYVDTALDANRVGVSHIYMFREYLAAGLCDGAMELESCHVGWWRVE